MRVLIATAGSHGDVLPYIAIGREMLARGHEVRLFANPYFADHAVAAGLPFVPVSTVDEYRRLFGELAESDPKKALQRVAAHYGDICRDYYERMKAQVVPGQTIAIGNTLLFAPRLLRETHGVPCAVVHLAPCVFRSNTAPARLLPNWIHAGSPALVKRAAWWLVDTFYYEPHFGKPLNRLRAALGLAPVTDLFGTWLHQADATIGLFPDWFAPRQPDWPRDVVLTGFPLYDAGLHSPLPDKLLEFIEAGPAPVAFSAGTANANAGSFFETSIAACRAAGVRGILVSHFPLPMPAPLPADVMHVAYAPFGSLLPKLAAFVHHGGIGSLSQALRAGVPQLIRPVAFDQFDNSAHAVRLGVARELLPRQYSAPAVAEALAQLSADPGVRRRCQAIAARFAQVDGIGATCDAIVSRCAPAAVTPRCIAEAVV